MIFLLDNYDSFTYNLYQYLPVILSGAKNLVASEDTPISLADTRPFAALRVTLPSVATAY